MQKANPHFPSKNKNIQAQQKAGDNQNKLIPKQKTHESLQKSTDVLFLEQYLPVLDSNDKYVYTLVLDLDETLVHYFEDENGDNFRIRPGAREFVAEMSQYYELVIFTAAMQEYADWILDQFDKDKLIKHRLYRQHTTQEGQQYIKDLRKIGRDLTKTIIIDNNPDCYKYQPENGIFVKTWLEDQTDTNLQELSDLLKEIVLKEVKDVRLALRLFRDQVIIRVCKGQKDPHKALIKVEN